MTVKKHDVDEQMFFRLNVLLADAEHALERWKNERAHRTKEPPPPEVIHTGISPASMDAAVAALEEIRERSKLLLRDLEREYRA